ncbi:uncharacterized protein LOC129654261 [Bubalus kerabau]|uniref:uncharacterized protein LOC129654261 n=1 Tax=Bubalus carabanensis TaxID=3119969 RepID=UPI00244ED6D9|nr:uncharacterized protein LOC129654261 [Bubalus carabanensis]
MGNLNCLGGSLIQEERRNTPQMSRKSRSSWLKRVSFWPHNRVHPITDSTEELPEDQPEELPISTLEEEALPNSIACEQASEHAPQEHLVLELPQAGAEDPPLPPLEAAGEASERGFTEDLPVNPACDRTEETPYVSKESSFFFFFFPLDLSLNEPKSVHLCDLILIVPSLLYLQVALSECENDCFLENISNSDAEDNSASAYDEYMADDEDSETVSKNTEVAYDCCLETPDEYMADDEDSETALS